jgi:hypothetical protein
MELNATLLGARLLKTVKPRLGENPNVHFWTDSMVTLEWINEGPYKGLEFIEIRIKKIHSTTQPLQWQHCVTTDNPADLASRGCKASDLLKSQLWLTGPTWLTKPDQWPKVPLNLCVRKIDIESEDSIVWDTFTRVMFEICNKKEHKSRPDHNGHRCVKRYAALLRLQKQGAAVAASSRSYYLRSKRPQLEGGNNKKPPDYFRKGNPKAFEKRKLATAEIGLLRDMMSDRAATLKCGYTDAY